MSVRGVLGRYGGTRGWSRPRLTGHSVTSYIQFSNTVSVATQPNGWYPGETDAGVQCSAVGQIFYVSVKKDHEEAVTYSQNLDPSTTRLTFNIAPFCNMPSYPPDFAPTQAVTNNPNAWWPYFAGISICTRPQNVAKGTAWSCSPNPTPPGSTYGHFTPTTRQFFKSVPSVSPKRTTNGQNRTGNRISRRTSLTTLWLKSLKNRAFTSLTEKSRNRSCCKGKWKQRGAWRFQAPHFLSRGVVGIKAGFLGAVYLALRYVGGCP